MKKKVCKVTCVIMCAVCIWAIYLCMKVITEPVSGFVDLRSLALAIYGGVGAVTAIIAFITGKIGWSSKE